MGGTIEDFGRGFAKQTDVRRPVDAAMVAGRRCCGHSIFCLIHEALQNLRQEVSK